MKQSERLKQLYDQPKSVFSARDLKQIWGIEGNTFQKTVQRMTKKELIYRLARGVYSLKEDFNRYELVNTVITPSYVSLNSALVKADVAFQYLTAVNAIATYTHKRKVGGLLLRYYKIKDEIFYDDRGVYERKGYTIAGPERAICDAFYLGHLPNIDHPDYLNKTLFREVSEIYPKTVQERVEELIEGYDL